MDAFTQTLVRAFDRQGIDLRNALISDAPQSLYIVASNLTTRKPVLFTGKVPILDAIQASSCLPFVFHPQIIYNNVYIDGGFYVHNLHKIVPPECLVFHISRDELTINQDRLKKMSLSDYSATLYEAFRSETLTPNVLWFKNNKIALMQELTPKQKKELFDEGFEQASRFFTKRHAQIIG